MSDSKPKSSAPSSPEEYLANPPEQLPSQVVADELRQANETLVPATTNGMPPTAQVLYAVVNQNGTLARGFGAVSSVLLGSNQFQVTFDHDLTQSAFVASVGFPGSSGVPPTGITTVVGKSGAPNAVLVATWLINETGANPVWVRYPLPFHLVVTS